MTGIAVTYVEDGPADGPVLVFSHALGADLRIWEAQAKPLADRGFRVVRYDLRGHGGSPAPAGPYTLADLGADALALLDQLGAATAHWAGVSLGGAIGLWLAGHASERIGRLVLCCTSADFGNPDMWSERAALVRAEGVSAVADAVVSRWVTPEYAAANPDRLAAFREIVLGCSAVGYAGCCLAIRDGQQTADLPRITAPTLVIGGAQDPATPPDAHQRPLAAGIPGARLAILSPGAHVVGLERADRVTELIIEHLEQA